MARKHTCRNCESSSKINTPSSNWRNIFHLKGRILLECKCGHGIYLGLFRDEYASTDEIIHLKYINSSLGIKEDNHKKILSDTPSKSWDFKVGQRVIDQSGSIGIIEDIYQEEEKLMLRVLFDIGYGDALLCADPEIEKIKKIETLE